MRLRRAAVSLSCARMVSDGALTGDNRVRHHEKPRRPSSPWTCLKGVLRGISGAGVSGPIFFSARDPYLVHEFCSDYGSCHGRHIPKRRRCCH